MQWLRRFFTQVRQPQVRRCRPEIEGLERRDVPAVFNPVYTATFGDAVTQDNAFTAADGKRYWTVDPGADSYQIGIDYNFGELGFGE